MFYAKISVKNPTGWVTKYFKGADKAALQNRFDRFYSHKEGYECSWMNEEDAKMLGFAFGIKYIEVK